MEIPSILIRHATDSETGTELTHYSYSAERDKSIERPISADDAIDHTPVPGSDSSSEMTPSVTDDLTFHSLQGEFELIENQRDPVIDEIEATSKQLVLKSMAAMSNSDREDSLESEWHEARLRRQAQPSGILTRESVDKQISRFFEKTRPSRKRPRL